MRIILYHTCREKKEEIHGMIDNNRSMDPEEISQFDSKAEAWWDPEGVFKPLHGMNPCRLQILKNHLCQHFGKDPKIGKPLSGLTILDIGCGGGLLAEPLARLGAHVTGIDAGDHNIRIAKEHAQAMGLEITYHTLTAESFLSHQQQFDAVISLEVLEHLAAIDPFLEACKKLLKPQGTLILSTLNRTMKSFLGAIVGGEYILRWLPRGTHDWKKFIRPSELSKHLRKQALAVHSLVGMAYHPLVKEWAETQNLDINYFCMAGHAI